MLARTGATQEEIAAAVGVSRVSAHHWMNGKAKPDAAKRKILRAQYGIPESAWEEEPHGRARAKARADASTALGSTAIPDGVLGKAAALEQWAHDLMKEVMGDKRSTPLEKGRLMQSIATTLNTIARLRGEMPMSKRKFLASLEWRNIADTIVGALTPYPKAAGAVAVELRRLEDDSAG